MGPTPPPPGAAAAPRVGNVCPRVYVERGVWGWGRGGKRAKTGAWGGVGPEGKRPLDFRGQAGRHTYIRR